MNKQFNIDGIMYEIKFALRRVGSVKNEIVVNDMEGMYEYLAEANRMDKKEIEKIVKHDDNQY